MTKQPHGPPMTLGNMSELRPCRSGGCIGICEIRPAGPIAVSGNSATKSVSRSLARY